MTRVKLWTGLGLLTLVPAESLAANPVPLPGIAAPARAAQFLDRGGDRRGEGEGESERGEGEAERGERGEEGRDDRRRVFGAGERGEGENEGEGEGENDGEGEGEGRRRR